VASSSTASSNHTDKVPIRDHRAHFDCTVTAPIRMLVDKRNLLQDAFLEFEVWHEIHSGHGVLTVGKEEKTKIGVVRVNLAEYVRESSGEDAQGVTRRHLLHESKVNCTLKVAVDMKQTEGDDKFDAYVSRHGTAFNTKVKTDQRCVRILASLESQDLCGTPTTKLMI
jgi:N-terminal C2 in EEIG1 and EHBP1 proteins